MSSVIWANSDCSIGWFRLFFSSSLMYAHLSAEYIFTEANALSEHRRLYNPGSSRYDTVASLWLRSENLCFQLVLALCDGQMDLTERANQQATFSIVALPGFVLPFTHDSMVFLSTSRASAALFMS